jgi:hypothetical protein
MPTRMTVFASATLAALVSALVLSVHWSSVQAAADNCLAKPNAAAPQGSHWYYRVDQAGNRRCWYLGPKGAKERQAWSPEPQPAPNPQPKPASQLMATATPATPAQLVDRAADATATFSMFSPALPPSANAADGGPGGPGSAISGAGGPAIMHPGDGYLLARPALTAADLAAAERPPRLNAKLEPMLVYVAGALAVVMLFRKVLRSFAIRRLRRRRLTLREQWNEELRATRSREPISQASAGTVAATHPAQSRRKSVTVPRTAEIPRPPADDRDTDRGIQALGVEERLQQLLYRWQQQSGGKPASACRAQYRATAA